MTTGRVHEPVVGRKYRVTRGSYKGRLMLFKRLAGDLKNNPPLICQMCSPWGEPTSEEIVVKLADAEI